MTPTRHDDVPGKEDDAMTALPTSDDEVPDQRTLVPPTRECAGRVDACRALDPDGKKGNGVEPAAPVAGPVVVGGGRIPSEAGA
jgi:hypothetical protein